MSTNRVEDEQPAPRRDASDAFAIWLWFRLHGDSPRPADVERLIRAEGADGMDAETDA